MNAQRSARLREARRARDKATKRPEAGGRARAEQRAATGVLPSDRAITLERFRDELGDWRVCVHSPFGARLHAPWALALERRLQERRGRDVQALWSDDGIVLRFDDADELPGREWLLPDPEEVEELVLAQLHRHRQQGIDGGLVVAALSEGRLSPGHEHGRDPRVHR